MDKAKGKPDGQNRNHLHQVMIQWKVIQMMRSENLCHSKRP